MYSLRGLGNRPYKKATFEKYTAGLIAKEQEEKEARLARLRPAIRNMLKGNPNVFHYTTFPTADKLFAHHPIWQQARNEAERRLIFEEYISELKQREVQENRASRTRAIDKLMHLFQSLQVDVLTRWRTAHNLVTESEEWSSDPELRKLPTLDILLAFEDYSRVREREFEEQTRKTQVEKTRKERKAREAFKELLQELVDAGKIKARSKWKEVYPLFREDPRYLDMLGNPGSNQLELFWDIVDGMDQKLDVKMEIVEEAIIGYNAKQKPLQDDGDVDMDASSNGFSVGPDTTEAEYREVLKHCSSEKLGELSQEELHLVFVTMHDAALKKQADEKRRAERRLRHQQDDFRYALKKLPEPLDLSLSYEDAVPLIEHLPEYKALESAEARRAAFAKFVKRQKERLRETAGSEDGGSTNGRKRKEPSRDYRDEHDRERERDRDSHRDDRERERRGSKHYYRHDDYDHGYSRSREYRDRDRDEKERDRDRDREYRSSKHYRDEKEDKKRDRERERRSDYGHEGRKDWDEPPRERTSSNSHDHRDKRDLEDRPVDERAEKRPRTDEAMDVDKRQPTGRAETPEEGEI